MDDEGVSFIARTLKLTDGLSEIHQKAPTMAEDGDRVKTDCGRVPRGGTYAPDLQPEWGR